MEDPSCRSFPEFYRKIRRERESSRGHGRLLRNVGGSEKDPARWHIRGAEGGREAVYRFLRRKREALYLAEQDDH